MDSTRYKTGINGGGGAHDKPSEPSKLLRVPGQFAPTSTEGKEVYRCLLPEGLVPGDKFEVLFGDAAVLVIAFPDGGLAGDFYDFHLTNNEAHNAEVYVDVNLHNTNSNGEQTVINDDGVGKDNDDGVGSDDTTAGDVGSNDTTDPDYNPSTDEEGAMNADSTNDNDDLDDNDEEADIPPLYSPSIDVQDNDGEGNKSDSHTIAPTGLPDNEGTSRRTPVSHATVNDDQANVHIDQAGIGNFPARAAPASDMDISHLFDVVFDNNVRKNLRDIEEEEREREREKSNDDEKMPGDTNDTNGPKAIKAALQLTFGKEDHALAAQYLLEYLRQKLYFGNAAVKLFMDDEQLRNGLVEEVDLPELNQDDFRQLFLLHADPTRFVIGEEGVTEKTKFMVKLLQRSSDRMFALIRNGHPHLRQMNFPSSEIQQLILFLIHGIPYRRYATPSSLSFQERYNLHMEYMQKRNESHAVMAKHMKHAVPEGSDSRLTKRIRLQEDDWKKRSARNENSNLFLSSATTVARELNMQAAAMQVSDMHKERRYPATDLPEGVQRLEESKEKPNNIFVNKLLGFFSDRYLDRRWRENEQRPVPSISDPVEYYPGRNSYAFAVDNGISEDLVDRIIEELGNNDEIEFIYPNDSAGGRAGSYMRMAFRDGGDSVPDPQDPGLIFRPFFLIGNELEGRQKLYAGVKAVPLEIKIMDLIEELVRPIVDEAYGPDHPFEVLMLQHVISRCQPYSDHNDNNSTTTTFGPSDAYRTSRGSKLPTYEEAITVTICFEERKSDGAGLYTIIWKDGKEEVCRLVIGPRGVHFQLPGMNYSSMKHGVYVNRNLVDTLGWRWVISARLLIFPLATNLNNYKEHLTAKTLEKLRKPDEMFGHDKSSIVTAPLKYLSGDKTHKDKTGVVVAAGKTSATKRRSDGPLNFSLFKNSGRYPQCSYDHVRQHHSDLVDIPRKIKHNTHPSLLCCCHTQLVDLVMAGIIPVIERSEKANKMDKQMIKVKYWPLFCFEEAEYFHFPVKFRTYDAEEMRNNAKLKWKPKDKDKYPMVYCNADKNLIQYTVFYAHQNYKQDYASLLAFILGIITWVRMIGSGGSPGTSGNNLNLASANDPESAMHGHCASPQPRNDMNTTLDQATMHDKVITIFLSPAVYDQLMKIVKSLSRSDPLSQHELNYYKVVLDGVSDRRKLPEMVKELGLPEKIDASGCFCLGVFYALSNEPTSRGRRKKLAIFLPTSQRMTFPKPCSARPNTGPRCT